MANGAAVEVLVVEDNASAVELIKKALLGNKFVGEVHVAVDGQEALDFIYAKGPHADRINKSLPRFIILDLGLPKVDGLEVLRNLRADGRTKDIPVIIMTASQAERDRVESYRLNVQRYILKPKDFTQLGEALSEMSIYWLLYKTLP